MQGAFSTHPPSHGGKILRLIGHLQHAAVFCGRHYVTAHSAAELNKTQNNQTKSIGDTNKNFKYLII
jgi:hypothetical protein